jgi:predicted nucleic acid-binding protein
LKNIEGIGTEQQLAFWDGMIFAAAKQDRAQQLLNEDLNYGQVVAGIKIVNPLL